ncbi:MAG: CHASE2 domain-containing protein [Proteobacteria bacterium]|nr:CHASE2 domain-containing protein [Pseudomonadota bacterium]MBI3497340.1 CHASE2 domain-containing protein [Pseudomonadota bacterium]
MIWSKLSRFGAFVVIVGLATLASVLVFNGLPLFGSFERWVENYRIATLTPPEPQHPDIVIIGITDDTLGQFLYSSPIDRGFLADLLELVQARGAHGVLLDVLFDRPTELAKDARLKALLEAYRLPLAISYGREPERLTPDEVAFLDDFVPAKLRGFGNLVTDDLYDGTVRGIYPGRALSDGMFVPGVATVLVERLGHPVAHRARALAYRGQPSSTVEPFLELPAHTVRFLPPALLAGKIVLIGGDFSLIDRHRSPFATAREAGAGNLPGIVLHAHAVAQLLGNRQAPEIGFWSTVPIIATAAAIGVLLGALDMAVALRIAAAVLLVIALWIAGFTLFRYSDVLVPVVAPSAALGLALWMTGTYIARRDLAQKRFIQRAFSRYLSPALLDELMNDPRKLSLDAERHELSFIFTDVAGFTGFSEQLDPNQLSALLNRYLEGVCEIVFRHGGMVDKFIGDAVFAIFNAPKRQDDHAQRAVACAIEIDRFASGFLEAELGRGGRFGLTRIGVHTGVASIGNFGSAERFEYTALGDAVNTASRLEGLNKYFGTRVCVSGSAASRCLNQPFRPLGNVVLKGKTEAIEVFEPLDATQEASPYVAEYLRAYALMARKSPEAYRVLAELGRTNPDDRCVALHLERIASGRGGTEIVMDEK